MSLTPTAEATTAAEAFARSRARTDALLKELAHRTKRRMIRNGVQSYDRNRHLPRLLLNGLYDADDARRVLNTPRPVVIRSIMGVIRHQREGLRAKAWWADVNVLIAARQAYVSERFAALADRRTAANLRNARAA